MHARISFDAIKRAWPAGLRDLFAARGVRLVEAAAGPDPPSIRFAEPCACWWDEATGDLVVEQDDAPAPAAR